MQGSIAAAWRDETVHIIAGGPSVAAVDLTRLAGRRTIVVNSSLFAWPRADMLVFCDYRWFFRWQPHVHGFAGEVVTTAEEFRQGPFLQLKKVRPQNCGISLDRTRLAANYTSLQAAINAAVHKGAARIILHGADMKPAADGRKWHHRPHEFNLPPRWPAEMIEDLEFAKAPLAALGVEVLIANPDSALPHWPKITFEDAIRCG